MTPLPERRALLTAALGFTQLQWRGETPEPATALHAYMDSWRGLGDVVTGIRAQGYAFTPSTVRTVWSRANAVARGPARGMDCAERPAWEWRSR